MKIDDVEKVVIEYKTKIPFYRNELVKESDWIDLDDPLLTEKFQIIWDEHVEGFKKRRRTLTEKDREMEWRVRLKQKTEKDASTTQVNSAEILNRFKEIQKRKALAQFEEKNAGLVHDKQKIKPLGPQTSLSNWKGTSGGKGKIINAQTSLSPQILGSQHTTTRPSIVGPQSMKGGDKKTKFIPQKSNIGPQFKEAKIDKDNNGNKNTNKQTEINTNKTKNINEKVPMNKKRKHQ